MLSFEELKALALAFDLQLRKAEPEPKGSVNTLYHLDTDRGRLFLRLAEGKQAEDVRYEAALIEHLAGRIPTPRLRRTRHGEPLLVADDRIVTVVEEAPGRDLCQRLVTTARAAAVGRALADLHEAGRTFTAQRESPYSFSHIVTRLSEVRARNVAALGAAMVTLEAEVEWLVKHRAAGLPSGVIHGDLFRDNVLFAGDRLTALLDFEQASDGALAYDVAVTLCAWCFGAGEFDATLTRALVLGYRSVRELEPQEAVALYAEARAAAHRFTVTRITDFYLQRAAGGRVEKDYRRFLARLEALRSMGPAGFARLAGLD